MNFETSPAAPWTPLRILTLPSGAVSSSWMWKRLMSVLTVIGLSSRRGPAAPGPLTGPLSCLYFTFS